MAKLVGSSAHAVPHSQHLASPASAIPLRSSQVPSHTSVARDGPANGAALLSESHIVSVHPDALRRRQQAAARKAATRAAAQAQAELATKAAWLFCRWEGDVPSNLLMARCPADLRDALASEGPLLVVDFFSSWCTACRRLYPKLKQIAENNPDVVFLKVNVGCDSLMEVAQAMNISQLPFFQFYKRGERVAQFAANLTHINRLRAEIAANKDCAAGVSA